MTIDWKVWDKELAPTLDYLNKLPTQITVDQADKIHDLLPDGFDVVAIEMSDAGVSRTALTYVLQMLPLIANYDYTINFGLTYAMIMFRYRDCVTYTFDMKGFCIVGGSDRVGNGFQWGGTSKRFQVEQGTDWRERFADSIRGKLGAGFQP